MNANLVVAAALCLAGCVHPNVDAARVFGVPPTLNQTERVEIGAEVAKRSDYTLFAISERKSGGLEVTLKRRDDPYKGLILRFVRVEGHWVEDRSKAEEVDYLIP